MVIQQKNKGLGDPSVPNYVDSLRLFKNVSTVVDTLHESKGHCDVFG